MRNKVFELINTLITFSNTKYTKEMLENELNHFTEKIDIKLEGINILEEKILSNQYIDNSLRLIDENIKANLIKKIEKDEQEYKFKSDSFQKVLVEKEKLMTKKAEKQKDYEILKTLLESLTNNLVENKTNQKEYETIIRSNESKIDKILTELNEINETLVNVNKDENYFKAVSDDIYNVIKINRNKLLELEKHLQDENYYINEEEKSKDENKLAILKEELKTLEKEKLILLTSPFCLANDLIRLIKDEKFNESNFKLKELISVLETYPYLNEINEERLNKELKKLNSKYIFLKKRVSLNEYNKDYYLSIEKEIDNLKQYKKDIQQEINTVRKIINNIDNNKTVSYLNTGKDSMFIISLTSDLLEYANKLKKEILPSLDEVYFKIKNQIILLEDEFNKNENVVSDSKKQEDIQEIKETDKLIRLVERRLATKKTLRDIYKELDLLISSLEFDEKKEYKQIKEIIEMD